MWVKETVEKQLTIIISSRSPSRTSSRLIFTFSEKRRMEEEKEKGKKEKDKIKYDKIKEHEK